MMRIRSFVTSAAIFGSLMASSALVSEALAQKGTVMSPSTGWAVSKVDDAAGPYCAMARQFNQNTVLTIARNEGQETSFALDFQRPVLKTRTAMQITLDPGAGQQRSYTIAPISNSAFVVRLGKDKSFFDAMARTGLLRVEMDGNAYHFNIADIDAGQSKLNACVVNMVMPAAGGSAPLTPGFSAPKISRETLNASFQKELDKLHAKVASLTSQNEALKVQLKTREGNVSESSASVAKLAGQVKELEDTNATLQKQLDLARVPVVETATSDSDFESEGSEMAKLRTENLRLKAELQTVAPQTDEIAALESKVEALEAQKQDLQDAVETKSVGESVVSELQAQIASLKAENFDLTNQIDKAAVKAELAGDTGKKMAALRLENAKLKATMNKKGVDAELLDQLKQQIAQSQNENRLLRETAAEAQKNLEEHLQQEMIAAVDKVYAEQSEVIVGLERQLEALKADSGRVEFNESENLALIEALQEQVILVETRNEKLEAAAAATQESMQDVLAQERLDAIAEVKAEQSETEIALRSQLYDLEAEKAALEAVIAEQSKQGDLVADLQTELTLAQDSYRALEERIEVLKAENDAFAAKMRAEFEGTVSQMDEEIGKLREEASLKDSQILELGSEIASLQALQEERDALQVRLSSLETEQQQNQTLISRIDELVDANQALQDQIASLQGDAQTSELSISSLEAENARLKDSLKTSQSNYDKVAALESKVEHLSTANAMLREQVADRTILDELEAAIAENVALREENSGKKQILAELEELRAEMVQKDKELAAMESLQGELKYKDAQLADMEALREELELTNQELAVLGLERDSLQERHKEVASAGLDAQASIDALNEKVAALEDQRDQLKAALSDVVAIAEGYKQDNALRLASIERLESDNQRLEAELEVADARAEALVVAADEEATEKPVVRSVVMMGEPEQPVQKKKEPVRMARAEKPAQAQPVVEKADAPVPSRKPEDTGGVVHEDAYSPKAVAARSEKPIQEMAVAMIEPAAGEVMKGVEADVEDLSHMNESQRREYIMKRNIERVYSAAAEAELQAAIADEEAGGEVEEEVVVVEEIRLQQSADPFKDIDVVNAGPEDDDKVPALRESAQDEPSEQAVVQNAAYVTPAGLSITALLTEANVSSVERIKKVDDAKGDFEVAYQWGDESVFGSAEQKTMVSPAQFDELVKAYLERTQSRCPGEFAVVPDNTVGRGDLRADSYEVACVGGQVSSGASLLFFNKGGDFAVVAHEAPAEKLEDAMRYRDRLMKAVTGS